MTGAFVAGVCLGVLDQLVLWNVDDAAPTSVVLLARHRRRPAAPAALGAPGRRRGESSWSVVGVGHGLPRAYARLREVRTAKVVLARLRGRRRCWRCRCSAADSQVNFGTITLAYAHGGAVARGAHRLGRRRQPRPGRRHGRRRGRHRQPHRRPQRRPVRRASACRRVAGGRRRPRARPAGAAGLGPVPGRDDPGLRRGHGALLPQPGQLRASCMPAAYERPELWGALDLSDERWLYVLARRPAGRRGVYVVRNLKAARAGRVDRRHPRQRAGRGGGRHQHRRDPAGRLRLRRHARRRGRRPARRRPARHRAVDLPGVDEPAGVLDGRHRRRRRRSAAPSPASPSSSGRATCSRRPSCSSPASACSPSSSSSRAAWPRRSSVWRDRLRASVVGAAPRPRVAVDEVETVEQAVEPGQPGGHPPRRRRSRADGRQRAPRAAGRPPARRARASRRPTARSRCSSASTSRSSATRSSPCSAPTAPASRRCSSRSPACCPPARAQVTFDGRDITDMPAEEIARLGLSLMPGRQGRVPHAHGGREPAARLLDAAPRPATPPRRLRDEAVAMFPILGERLDQLAGDLSGGEQQLLSLAMAFVTRPKLLCIDELSLGLAPDRRRPADRQGARDPRPRHHRRGGRAVGERRPPAGQRARVPGEGRGPLPGPDRRAARPARHPAVGVHRRPTARPAAARRASRPRRRPCRRRGSGRPAASRSRPGASPSASAASGRSTTSTSPSTRPDRRAHRPQRRRQDHAVRRALRVPRPPTAARCCSTASTSPSWPPHRRAIAEVGRSFQEARLYPSLTGRGRHRRGARAAPRQPRPAGRRPAAAGVGRLRGVGRASGSTSSSTCSGLAPVRRPAHRRAVDRHPPHRRAGLPAGPGPGRRAARRAVGRASPSARPRRSARCCAGCRPRPAARWSSSSTTWRCCRRCATSSWPSSRARSSPAARPRRCCRTRGSSARTSAPTRTWSTARAGGARSSSYSGGRPPQW